MLIACCRASKAVARSRAGAKAAIRSGWSWWVGAALLMLIAAPWRATADEYDRVEAFWLDAPSTAGLHQPAVLNLPGSWRTGDAAVLLLAGATERRSRHDALRGSLLHAGSAILDLAWLTPAPEMADVEAAAALLRRDHGAGLLVVIGLGPLASEASLRAQGPEGHGFAARVGIVADTPVIRLGARPMPAEERWPERAAPFCAALAWALAPRPATVEHASAADPAVYGTCVSELIPADAAGSAPRLARAVAGPPADDRPNRWPPGRLMHGGVR